MFLWMYIYVVGIVSKYAEVYNASFYFLFSFLFQIFQSQSMSSYQMVPGASSQIPFIF